MEGYAYGRAAKQNHRDGGGIDGRDSVGGNLELPARAQSAVVYRRHRLPDPMGVSTHHRQQYLSHHNLNYQQRFRGGFGARRIARAGADFMRQPQSGGLCHCGKTLDEGPRHPGVLDHGGIITDFELQLT